MTFVYNHNVLRMKARLSELEEELSARNKEKDQLQEAIRLLEDYGIVNTDESKEKRVPIETRKAEIATLVQERPGIRVGEVAQLLGLSSQRVVQIVNTMAKDGQIRRKESGGLLPG